MFVIKQNFRDIKPPPGSQLNLGHSLVRGLVGCWLMNEGGGNKVSNIVLGKTNALTSAPFNSNDLVFTSSVPSSINLDNFKRLLNFTAIFKLYPTQLSGGGNTWNTFADWSSASQLNYLMQIPSGKITFFSGNGGSSQDAGLVSNATLGINKYVTVALVRNKNVVSIFVNGNLDNTQTSSYSGGITTGEVNIGCRVRNDSNYGYSGRISYALIYSRALSPSEIQELYIAPYQMIMPIRRRFISSGTGDVTPPPVVTVGGGRGSFLTMGCG